MVKMLILLEEWPVNPAWPFRRPGARLAVVLTQSCRLLRKAFRGSKRRGISTPFRLANRCQDCDAHPVSRFRAPLQRRGPDTRMWIVALRFQKKLTCLMHPPVDAFEKHGLLDAEEVRQRLATLSYPAASKICQDSPRRT